MGTQNDRPQDIALHHNCSRNGDNPASVPDTLLSREGHSLQIGLIRYFGALPIILGISMYLRCAWDFTFIGRGTPLAVDPPRRLVIHRHYQNVRNPMYVGIVLLLLGEALLFESPSLLGYATLMFLMFHLFIILYEAPALKRKF